MSDLKSAWEIAREKASRLGKLSAQELQQQREQQCRESGRAIAQRYLDSPEPLSLPSELNKYQEGKDLVSQATVSHLIQAIDLQGKDDNDSSMVYPRLEKIARGIASLQPKSQPIIDQITQLAREYEGAIAKVKQEIESNGQETLHRLRISGTAVGDINIKAAPEWQQSWHRLAVTFKPRLDSLKQQLTSGISSV
jgi:hypothetical protein